jgi:glycosyltransferase involved in cell wall biosynthesis
MPIIYPPPLSEISANALPPVREEWDYTPLPKPIPVTEQRWQAGTRPLVTVRCTTFNHERFIRQAIDGFLMQETTFPVQILVHDDASTDGTAAIVREYAERYPDLIVAVLQPENTYSKGTSRGLRVIEHGRYIAPCEGDDYWISPTKLERQASLLERHPDMVLCGARSLIWRDGHASPCAVEPAWISAPDSVLDPLAVRRSPFWIHNAARMWRLSFLDDYVAQFPERVFRYEFPLIMHALFKSLESNAPIGFLNETTTVYRLHAGGIWASIPYRRQRDDMMNYIPIGADIYRGTAIGHLLRHWECQIRTERAFEPAPLRKYRIWRKLQLGILVARHPIAYLRYLGSGEWSARRHSPLGYWVPNA